MYIHACIYVYFSTVPSFNHDTCVYVSKTTVMSHCTAINLGLIWITSPVNIRITEPQESMDAHTSELYSKGRSING